MNVVGLIIIIIIIKICVALVHLTFTELRSYINNNKKTVKEDLLSLSAQSQCPLSAPAYVVAFFMLYCYALLFIYNMYYVYVFIYDCSYRSFSLFILYVLSRSSFPPLSSELSWMVTPCTPGPTLGFFALKGSFSLPLCLPRGLGSGFSTSAKHLEPIVL